MAELTAVAARNAKPREKMYRLAAGRGLYLQIMPTGGKYWRLKYRFGDAQRMIGLGVFPEVSLAEAREQRDEARRKIAAGIDPSLDRKAAKAVDSTPPPDDNLRTLTLEWLATRKTEWTDSYFERVSGAIERDIFPYLGDRAIGSIEPRELLAILQRVQARGAKETGLRLRRWLSPVFRYAIVQGKAERDPCADLKGILQPVEGGHMPSITDPDRIGEMLRAIEGYRGTAITRAALALSPLVFTRPGELRWSTWAEFDLSAATWTIPAVRMKMRKAKKAKAAPHIVPLSRQAVRILEDLRPLTIAGKAQYVFPGELDSARPISENTLNAALHRLGFKGEIVMHGLRHMASTALNEAGWASDAVERQLAHKDPNAIRDIYNQAKYLEERRQMMQAWADHLDALRSRKESGLRRRQAA